MLNFCFERPSFRDGRVLFKCPCTSYHPNGPKECKVLFDPLDSDFINNAFGSDPMLIDKHVGRLTSQSTRARAMTLTYGPDAISVCPMCKSDCINRDVVSAVDNGSPSLEVAKLRTIHAKCSSPECGYPFCTRCDKHSHLGLCDIHLDIPSDMTPADEIEYRRTHKACPHCFVPTSQNGGCASMSCPNCKQNWCWRCGGKRLSDIHQHEHVCPTSINGIHISYPSPIDHHDAVMQADLFILPEVVNFNLGPAHHRSP